MAVKTFLQRFKACRMGEDVALFLIFFAGGRSLAALRGIALAPVD
ncbi:MAG TPA: hypothetical protein VJ718_04965 [Candidatus Binataceae bacterium]|nr:hypothetical protein [Candidatus Binataceae bacterium]